ncbi:MAG: alcohol dehydrogenase catalytic domain-containing protein [Leptospiraceae bacterium]|nr:zinc-binding dehydrogenase [Leptospiraceae bacterium]MCP5503429.1 alcohol dehydrogenase catalytic domain-containing protein [Leptospiraceae bacterium]
MRAAVLHKNQTHLQIEEKALPQPGKNEVKVNIKCCGVCGSDVHLTVHKQIKLKHYPLTLGHEASGIVVSVGEGVSRFKKGERVVIAAGTSCGHCKFCEKGLWNLCPEVGVLGVDSDGAFAEEIMVQDRYLIHLPETIPFDEGAILADAVSTPYHALKYAGKIDAGEVVAIFGCGGLGIHAVLLAKVLGASKVIAFDVDRGALENAYSLGADEVLNLKEIKHSGKLLRELTNGVDLVCDFSGHYANIRDSLRAMNSGGRMVMVGIGKNSLEIPFPLMMVEKQISIIGSYGCDRRSIPELIDLYTQGKLNLKKSITSHHPLEEVNDCLENLYHRNGNPIRYIICPNGRL